MVRSRAYGGGVGEKASSINPDSACFAAPELNPFFSRIPVARELIVDEVRADARDHRRGDTIDALAENGAAARHDRHRPGALELRPFLELDLSDRGHAVAPLRDAGGEAPTILVAAGRIELAGRIARRVGALRAVFGPDDQAARCDGFGCLAKPQARSRRQDARTGSIVGGFVHTSCAVRPRPGRPHDLRCYGRFCGRSKTQFRRRAKCNRRVGLIGR